MSNYPVWKLPTMEPSSAFRASTMKPLKVSEGPAKVRVTTSPELMVVLSTVSAKGTAEV